MTKTRILDLASKNDGLLIEFTELVRELIDDCKITARPVGDGWTIVQAIKVGKHSPYQGRAKRGQWARHWHERVSL